MNAPTHVNSAETATEESQVIASSAALFPVAPKFETDFPNAAASGSRVQPFRLLMQGPLSRREGNLGRQTSSGEASVTSLMNGINEVLRRSNTNPPWL
jgi:hypothetical protein